MHIVESIHQRVPISVMTNLRFAEIRKNRRDMPILFTVCTTGRNLASKLNLFYLDPVAPASTLRLQVIEQPCKDLNLVLRCNLRILLVVQI